MKRCTTEGKKRSPVSVNVTVSTSEEVEMMKMLTVQRAVVRI